MIHARTRPADPGRHVASLAAVAAVAAAIRRNRRAARSRAAAAAAATPTHHQPAAAPPCHCTSCPPAAKADCICPDTDAPATWPSLKCDRINNGHVCRMPAGSVRPDCGPSIHYFPEGS